MDNSSGQAGRPILGRAKSSPQGDLPTQTGGSSGAPVSSAQEAQLSDSLKQQCAVNTGVVTEAQTAANDQAAGFSTSWNLKAAEFVPVVSETGATDGAAPAVADTGSDASDQVIYYYLDCALDRLSRAPGSFNEEASNIITLLQQLVTQERQVEYVAESIVQYAINYRHFTYDASTLCQRIACAFDRQFGEKRSTFRDYVLRSVHKEHKQLDEYLSEGARDRMKDFVPPSEASGDWTPSAYRTYVNGLVQFTGFLFMNLLTAGQKRIPVIGFAERIALLKLLRAGDADYLESVLIVLKECGLALSELDDTKNEWSASLDILDELLKNCLPGASLLSDPAEAQLPQNDTADDSVRRLRISAPLRKQLVRVLDQARGWSAQPGAASKDSEPKVCVQPASEQAPLFEFDPNSVDPSYIEQLPTGSDCIIAPALDDIQYDAEVAAAYEEFTVGQNCTDANAAPQRNETDEDYDAELESFLASIPNQSGNSANAQ